MKKHEFTIEKKAVEKIWAPQTWEVQDNGEKIGIVEKRKSSDFEFHPVLEYFGQQWSRKWGMPVHFSTIEDVHEQLPGILLERATNWDNGNSNAEEFIELIKTRLAKKSAAK